MLTFTSLEIRMGDLDAAIHDAGASIFMQGQHHQMERLTTSHGPGRKQT
jgi:hypothetical protein